MRVCVVAADEGGCGYYRMRWPAEALQQQGYDVHLSDREDADQRPANEFDVVVIQRPLRALMVAHIQQLQAAGIAVVVEIDDDFSAIQANNYAYKDMHPKTSPDSNWNHLARAAAIADMVTVSTPALAERYGKHGRCAVLPNYVPKRYLEVPKPEREEALRIGWTGSLKTHPGDLHVTGRGIYEAMLGTPAKFVAIGDKNVPEVLGVSGDCVPWADLVTEYPGVVASLDIGIVPLVDNSFNRAKSWLKGLEYAALGVPFVASPLPEYERLEAAGAGRIARRPREWTALLRQFMTNDIAYEEAQQSGRAVAAQLTIEEHAPKWMDAYATALANRKKLVAA